MDLKIETLQNEFLTLNIDENKIIKIIKIIKMVQMMYFEIKSITFNYV